MAAHSVFFLSRSLISLYRWYLFGCLEWHLFSPKEIVFYVFVWGSDWERTRAWSATNVIRDPSWWRKLGPPWCGVTFLLKGAVPEVAMALILCPWSLVPEQPLCEKGVCDGPYVDILTLKPWEWKDGHDELLLWRYVEVDGKRINQMGGPLGSTILSPSVDS